MRLRDSESLCIKKGAYRVSKGNKPKYPREIIHSITSKNVKIESLSFDVEKSLVIPLDKDGNPVYDYGSSRTEYYIDCKGKKHDTSTWFNTGGEYGTEFAFGKYDSIYVCDTATEENFVGNLNASLSVILKVVRNTQNTDDPSTITGKYHATICWVWRGVTENIEPYAWGLFAVIHNRKDPDKKVCLIVDSEYPKLEQFNRREIPLTGDNFWYEDGLYLPKNFELNYATSNSTQSWETFMMRRCDKISKQRLKVFKDSLTLSGGVDSDFALYRYWDANGVEEKCF